MNWILAAIVTLTWNASSTPDVNYRVKWGYSQGGPYNHVVEVGPGLTTTINEPWPFDTDVYFTAYAYNAVGESGPSNEVRLHTPIPQPTPPAPPTNLQLFLDAVARWWREFFSI